MWAPLGFAAALLLALAAVAEELRGFDELRAIEDRDALSAALFVEIGKVLRHPRCANCHTDDGRPRQGENSRPHEPPVAAGAIGHGRPGMRCRSCHGVRNAGPGGIAPGAGDWHMPPAFMALGQRSLGDICRQWKTPTRTGGKSLRQVAQHLAQDKLVAWAYSPGGSRSTPPGNQALLGRYANAWIDTGAVCPEE